MPAVTQATPIQVMGFPDGEWFIANGGSSTYIEDGITATGGLTSGPFSAGVLHFGNVHLPASVGTDFTTGGLFAPVSIDVLAGRSGWCSQGGFAGVPPQPVPQQCSGSSYDDPFQYMSLSGYLEGMLVASLGIYRPRGSPWETILLTGLGTIDRLHIEATEYFELGLTGHCDWMGTNCATFDVDNLKIQSVPEPATLTLLGIGLIPLAWRRMRRIASA
jgi:PEP-CTERM motif-containing protein